VVTHQLQVERRTGKVRRSKTDVLPTVPRNQPTNLLTKSASSVSVQQWQRKGLSERKLRPQGGTDLQFYNPQTLTEAMTPSISGWRCHVVVYVHTSDSTKLHRFVTRQWRARNLPKDFKQCQYGCESKLKSILIWGWCPATPRWRRVTRTDLDSRQNHITAPLIMQQLVNQVVHIDKLKTCSNTNTLPPNDILDHLHEQYGTAMLTTHLTHYCSFRRQPCQPITWQNCIMSQRDNSRQGWINILWCPKHLPV